MTEILGEHNALIETLRMRGETDETETRESSEEQERTDPQRPTALWLDAIASSAEECLVRIATSSLLFDTARADETGSIMEEG